MRAACYTSEKGFGQWPPCCRARSFFVRVFKFIIVRARRQHADNDSANNDNDSDNDNNNNKLRKRQKTRPPL
jgi:hypothetical protein